MKFLKQKYISENFHFINNVTIMLYTHSNSGSFEKCLWIFGSDDIIYQDEELFLLLDGSEFYLTDKCL